VKAPFFKPNLTRLGVILIVTLVLFSALSIKLIKIQFIDASVFIPTRDKPLLGHVRIIEATRGEIFDRNGYKLAENITTYDIGCEPRNISNKGWKSSYENEFVEMFADIEATAIASIVNSTLGDIRNNKGFAETLAPILNLDVDYIQNCTTGNSSYKPIANDFDFKTVEKLRSFSLRGVVVDAKRRRAYPEKNMASNLIGFTGNDNKGLSGIELAFNDILSGTDGEKIIPPGSNVSLEAIKTKTEIDGSDVYLTIDSIVQYQAEEELKKTCEEWNAKGGCAVVLDAQTGDLLAVAQYPTFDLNNFKEADQSIVFLNRATSFSYEPGSVIKGIIAASALDEGVIDIENDRFTCNGHTKIADRTFSCPLRAHGTQTLQEILINSCNLGFTQVGQKLGAKRFYDNLTDFGLGELPGSGLPEEAGIIKKPQDMWATDLPAMSFGTGLNVTPLQLTMAYGAIANGGVLVKPNIIRYLYDPNKWEHIVSEPTPKRQVVSRETADTTLELLTETGKEILRYHKVPGFNIAGKTGTASIWDPTLREGKGDYSRSKYNCSFCGIIPSDLNASRRFVIFVTVEEPHKSPWVQPFGANVAAPCFSRIAQKVLPTLHVSPPEPEKQEVENESN